MTAGKSKKGKAAPLPRSVPPIKKQQPAPMPIALPPGIPLRPIEELEPYARNARTHSPEQIEQIAASIVEFGFLNPVLLADGGIVAGHGRVLAAKELGLDALPWVDVSHLSPDQRRAYVLADNRLAESAGWDRELLRLEISALEANEYPIEVIGFTLEELEEFTADPEPAKEPGAEDAAPELPAAPVSQIGDLWILGRHRLLCGDGTDRASVDRVLGKDGAGAWVFTDPPYGLGFDKEGQERGKSDPYAAVLNDASNATALAGVKLIQELSPAAVFLWGANHYASGLPDATCWLVWDKQGGKRVDYADVELCFTDLDSPARMFTHIWDGFRRDSEKGEKRVHFNQKPVKLITDIWEFFGDKIPPGPMLDPFGGSGSFLMAAELTGRSARVIELGAGYVDVMINRWQEYTGQEARLATGKAAKPGATFTEIAGDRNG